MSPTPALPLVSIVLPVYNGERYLAESVESCLAQTYRHWELLIVDDASSDATPSLAAGFAAREPRVRVLRNEANRRLPGTLNVGFAAARGELLTWTSDDNRFHPGALETLVGLLAARPEVDFIYADYDVIDERGTFLRTATAASPRDLAQMYDGVACFLYRRAVYERIGGYAEDLYLAEDYDYFLRILATGYSMLPVHERLYDYRVHARSLTGERRGLAFAAAERALVRHLTEFDGADARLRAGLRLYLASLARWQGRHGRALGYATRAAWCDPRAAARRFAAYVEQRARGASRRGDRGRLV